MSEVLVTQTAEIPLQQMRQEALVQASSLQHQTLGQGMAVQLDTTPVIQDTEPKLGIRQGLRAVLTAGSTGEAAYGLVEVNGYNERGRVDYKRHAVVRVGQTPNDRGYLIGYVDQPGGVVAGREADDKRTTAPGIKDREVSRQHFHFFKDEHGHPVVRVIGTNGAEVFTANGQTPTTAEQNDTLLPYGSLNWAPRTRLFAQDRQLRSAHTEVIDRRAIVENTRFLGDVAVGAGRGRTMHL